MNKAYNLCKYIKKFLMISRDNKQLTDKDHYMNKRLKLSGDLLADLFRVNLRALVQDVLYNFQRLVKRGKFQSIKIIIRDQLLTSRIKSAMATGAWVGGRKGVSQNIDRTNFIATTSHLQRVVSLLSSAQENFEARELHPTHWGRLCPVETPEGTPIGLRKNLATLAKISQEELAEDKIKKLLEGCGLAQNG
jgi:DNA-directed RNA polymerase beta subunit